MQKTHQATACACQLAAECVADKAYRGIASRASLIDYRGTPWPHRMILSQAVALERGAVRSPLVVDKKNRVIRNASAMTIGPARGHGFSIDRATIEQIAQLINAAGTAGVKAHWKHGEIETVKDDDGQPAGQVMADQLGTLIGRVRGARIVGNSVLVDLYVADYADDLPGLANAGSYLLRIAETDPAGVGLSAVFDFELEPVSDGYNIVDLVARPHSIESVDVVGAPAANPGGLVGMHQVRRPRHLVPLDTVTLRQADLPDPRFFVRALSALAPSVMGAHAVTPRIHVTRWTRTFARLAIVQHWHLIDAVARDLIDAGCVDVA